MNLKKILYHVDIHRLISSSALFFKKSDLINSVLLVFALNSFVFGAYKMVNKKIYCITFSGIFQEFFLEEISKNPEGEFKYLAKEK